MDKAAKNVVFCFHDNYKNIHQQIYVRTPDNQLSMLCSNMQHKADPFKQTHSDVVMSVKARCSVIAAANPIGGRYDSLQTFSHNVNLTDPIISCFDILCLVKDIADPVRDETLALFIVDNHYKSQPTGAKLDESISNSQDEVSASAHPEIIPQDLLKKYVTYSKLNVFPKLLGPHQEKLMNVYDEPRDLSSRTIKEDYNPLKGLPTLKLKVEELQNKAAEYEIYYLMPFFTGSLFFENFEFDERIRVIRCALPLTEVWK